VETLASPRRLIELLGGMYSRELGIDLTERRRAEIFLWFLAAKLMGARIRFRRLRDGPRAPRQGLLPEAPCDQLPDAGNLPQAPAARYPGLAWEPARSL
jgi:hypothetical protein